MKPLTIARLQATWTSLTGFAARTARQAAQWAGRQSWGRLLLLSVLALMAESILSNNLLHWRDESEVHVHHRDHRASASPRGPVSPREDDVHIGWDGITVKSRDGRVTVTGTGIAVTPPGAGAAATPAGSSPAAPAPDAAGIPAAGPIQPAPADGTSPAHPAAPAMPPSAAAPGTGSVTITVPTVGPVTPSGATKPAAPDDAEPADDDEDSGDAADTVEVRHSHTLGTWLHDALKGLVLLVIVYLLAARLVMREAARSEARATEAEAQAAQATTQAANAEANAEREALRFQLAQAQLQALQAQVEPHFLFNTLASVEYLIETDPPRAAAMQRHLIQYLRSALPQMRDHTSQLGREVDLVGAYLEILKVRMEDRLQIDLAVPEGLRSADFPPMLLQSLVENAIRHGLEPKAEGGTVRVSASVVDGALLVAVADTGIGLTVAAGSSGSASTAGSGLGLRNVAERLALLYPGQAAVNLTDNLPQGAIATVRLPYRVAAGNGNGGASGSGRGETGREGTA